MRRDANVLESAEEDSTMSQRKKRSGKLSETRSHRNGAKGTESKGESLRDRTLCKWAVKGPLGRALRALQGENTEI